MNNEQKSTKLPFGGLWEHKDKNGKTYFSGYINGLKLKIFKNDYKDNDKQPDYKMYLQEPEKKNKKENADNDVIPF